MKILRKVCGALLLLIISTSATFGSNDIYSYGPDGKNYFNLSVDKILVKFRKSLSFEQKQAILTKEKNITRLTKENVLPAPDVSIVDVVGLDEEGLSALLERLQANPDVDYANPFLVYNDGTLQGIQDRIIVRLKSSGDYDKLKTFASRYKLDVLDWDDYDQNVYILGTTKNSTGNALEVANQLYETGQFDYVEPDFLLLLKRFNTNDTYLNYQWSLNNTGSSIQYSGTAGADMNVFDAWGITQGSSSIKVAILDEGVDLNHPDLLANLLSGYDATGQGSGGNPSGDDAHGTACAGIVAAVGNNNRGVAGVAYGCKIVPVRIAYSSGNSWVTSNSWIGNAINWAWTTGNADVLSNSWGGGSSSSTINNAISGAVNNGRGGLGAPVLFAAGNDNGSVSYPATLTNVISVAAMSMCYERKNPSSCDGETWWGSNYGTNLDVAAPGVKVYSTDISGSDGYSSGNYVPNFNGTSSSTPNAAGVMALILSANPSLTQTQARNAMETTCRKVGSYTYNSNVSGQSNGTWSSALGYGLIDAYQALLSVAPQVQDDAGISSINSPVGTVCSSTISPSVTLNNYGSNTLTSATINYQLDNGTVNAYSWTGLLASASSTIISLPNMGVSSGSHTFAVYTSNPNGNSDNNPNNDAVSSTFTSGSNPLTLTIVLDNYGSETTWEIRNGSNQVIASGGPYSNQQNGMVVTTNLCVEDGCFDFTINDSYGDGICCGYGQGSYQLVDDLTSNVLASGGSFNYSETTNFCVQSTVPLNASISSSSDVSCNGGNDGSASASASGGATPYQYVWSNGGTGSSVSGLSAGTYTVTVTDGGSNTSTASVTISQPAVLATSVSSSNVSCNGGSNGSVNLSVSGGTSGYSYLWSNGATTQDLSGLLTGAYSVTVTDANGCTAMTSASISEPSALLASASGSNASCFGGNDGAVSLSVSGGVTGYSYLWSNGSTSQNLSDVSAGTYTVTVTDANGCSAVASGSVGSPSAINLIISASPSSCGTANDGSVDLSASNGVAPYTYQWSNGSTSEDLSSVSEGSYSVIVTDANGCTATTTAIVGQQSTLSASASGSDVSCNGDADGSLSASASGGTAPYSYLWSNGYTSVNVSGVSVGTYTVTVTDINGCTTSASASISQPAALSVSVSVSDETCDENDGSASASVSGGIAPYNYAWSNGSTSASINSLAAAAYSVTVTDANGCSAISSFDVEYDCGGCTYVIIDNTDFESNWGIWNDGGSDCSLSSNSSFANSGTYSIQLRDNSGVASSTYSYPLDLSNYTEITISFSYMSSSFDNYMEDLWLQVSNDGGSTYTTIEEWNYTDEFVNNRRYNEQVIIPGPFTTAVRLRFMSDASANSDWIYLDDIEVSGCKNNELLPTCWDGIQNGNETGVDCGGPDCTPCLTSCSYTNIDYNDFEQGWGLWNDGGSDCSLSNNASYSDGGTYAVELRDNTNSSVTTTDNIDLSSYEELTVSFSYITNSMDNINEDFWLQVSYNGGSSYSTVEEWNWSNEFVNNRRYNEQVIIPGPFTSNTRLRFRCDASANSDWVYIDNISIDGCLNPSARKGNDSQVFTENETLGHISIAEEIEDRLTIYPNPATEQVNLIYSASKEQDLKMVVCNMMGQVVYQETRQINTGENRLSMGLTDMANGVYVVSFIGKETRISQRLVVQK